MTDFVSEIKQMIRSNNPWIYIDVINSLIDKGISIRDMNNNCPELPIYEIISNMLKVKMNDTKMNALRDYYNSLQINEQRCLVISDTHIGRLLENETYNKNQTYENERGLYSAYNYALKNGIGNVIHLGDLIEGFAHKKLKEKIPTQQEQVEYLERIYPRRDEVKTYLLYGNHDVNLIEHDSADKNFYKVCHNMELIGSYFSYINFCGNIIKLDHNEKIFSTKLELPHEFTLSGHSHHYFVNQIERKVIMPLLSSSATIGDIGFIEMIDEENNYLFKYLDQNGNEVKEKERVLIKKNTNN